MSIKKTPKPARASAEEKERAFAIKLIEHLVVPTFVLDPQCRVVVWNLACERLTGMPASELIGTSDHWRAFYDEPRPCLADLIVQKRTSEIRALYVEHENSTEDHPSYYAENWCVMPQGGTRLYLAMDAGPIYDSAGKLQAVIETFRDMTVQKEAQLALELLATQDGLTGIANRRRFDEILEMEWQRGLRNEKTMSLLMVDVDKFKSYNDTYGHQAGDECLKRIAAVMSDCVQRPIDLVSRYGGEEFAVILPNATIKGAAVVAERIRLAVEKMELPCEIPAGRYVTVSIGAATIAVAPGASTSQLLAAADIAMYEAKHNGRNLVVTKNMDVAGK